jgi:hypothetical protein
MRRSVLSAEPFLGPSFPDRNAHISQAQCFLRDANSIFDDLLRSDLGRLDLAQRTHPGCAELEALISDTSFVLYLAEYIIFLAETCWLMQDSQEQRRECVQPARAAQFTITGDFFPFFQCPLAMVESC